MYIMDPSYLRRCASESMSALSLLQDARRSTNLRSACTIFSRRARASSPSTTDGSNIISFSKASPRRCISSTLLLAPAITSIVPHPNTHTSLSLSRREQQTLWFSRCLLEAQLGGLGGGPLLGRSAKLGRRPRGSHPRTNNEPAYVTCSQRQGCA